MHPSPDDNRSTPAQFRSKLTTYLTGVMIGFMMLGIIYYFKHLAVEQAHASQSGQTQQQVEQQSPPGPMPASQPTEETGTAP